MKNILKILMVATAVATAHNPASALLSMVNCCTDSLGRQCSAPTLSECSTLCASCWGGGTTPPQECTLRCPVVSGDEPYTSSIRDPYEKRIAGYRQSPYPECKCTPYYHYRCKDGYYGRGSLLGDSIPDCKTCPTPTDTVAGNIIPINIANSAPGSFNIIQCYISPTLEFQDDAGIYTYTENCYYEE